MPEIGYQLDGLPGWGTLSHTSNETNPDLLWPLSIDVFDRMRSEDSQVSSVMRAVTQPILSTKWEIDPAGAEENVIEHVATDFGLPIKGRPPLAPLRTRGRFSWTDHMRLALLELVYGHSVFEQVYRPEDGLLRLAKLAWRPPRTIAEFEIARDGGLDAIRQHGIGVTAGTSIAGRATLQLPAFEGVRIPVDRLVVYVNEREGGNWLGRSLLRTAYKNWLLKDRLLRIQALTAERNGLGMPVYTAAPIPEGLKTDADAMLTWLDAELDRGLAIAKAARAGEMSGVSIPYGANFEFKGVAGDLPDTDKPIRYQDEQIARAVLAHFLNLGTETGSWALGSTFADFFTNSLNAIAQHIADITNQHVVEDLVDRNWGPTARAPRIVPAKIGAQHPATADAIKALIDSKAITPDESLEADLRSRYGLPVKAAADPASNTDAEAAREAAEVIQKAYLGVGVVMTRREARELARRAGAQLDEEPPGVGDREEAA